MSGNSKTPPMMESCSITSMHITTLGRPENGAEISFQSTFKGMEANGKPWGVEVTVKLRGADDTLYDIAATAQAEFSFPDGTSDTEAVEYISRQGSTRVFDFVRSYILQATACCAYGPMTIPDIGAARGVDISINEAK